MKYIAIFDIPDGNSIGCALAKTCPNDGKVRCDADFETVYANTEKLSDYLAPKWLEVPFYRQLVIDHMEAAGVVPPGASNDEETVHKETVRIHTRQGTTGHRMRVSYYIGQLSLLDHIQKLQNTYVHAQKSNE